MEIHLDIPQKWNDLSPVQLQNISHQFHCFHQIVQDSPETLQVTKVVLYLNLAKELLRGNKWKAIRTTLREMRPKAFEPYVQFLDKRNDRTKFIPSIKVAGIEYHAPAQRIRNSTIGEFSFADAAFYNWRSTQKTIWLTVLCAALYREAAENPNEIDIRKPFVKQAVDARADRFRAMPFKTQLAIGYTYEGCRNHIADKYPIIFPKPVEIEGQTVSKSKKYISFGEIVLDKIEGDPSKLEATNNVMVYDFLNIVAKDLINIKKQRK